MVTKGIIIKLPTMMNSGKYLVRVPFFENAIQNAEEYLCEATLSEPTGISSGYNIGDVVYCAFEDNNQERAVIVGKLAIDGVDNKGENAYFTNLEIEGKALLPKNTTIGTVNPKSLSALSGARSNLQWQIDDIRNQIAEKTVNISYVLISGDDYRMNIS